MLPRLPEGDPHAGEPVGVYVHVPFCSHLCSYCDFYKLKERPAVHEALVGALERQLAALARAALAQSPELTVGSVYVGGGTPTALGSALLGRLLGSVRDAFPVDGDAEVTVECNPEDASDEILETLRSRGVDRLSLGVQSLDGAELAMLSRTHSAAKAAEAVARGRAAGFRSVSVDLIVGLPSQDVAAARRTLDGVAAMRPDHVSAYLLELDKDTPIRRAIDAGELPEPDDAEQADIYGAVSAELGRAGLLRYEVSSLARAGHESRHNLGYWRDAPYLGAGPSAASSWGPHRFTRRPDLKGFLLDPEADVGSSAFDLDLLSPARRVRDAVMLGLRVTEGIDLGRIHRRHVVDAGLRAELSALERDGLLAREGDRAWIPAGMLAVGNFVFERVSGARVT